MGIGTNGRVFSQPARTRNISGGGALLSGIEHDLKIGDTIGVQRGEKKARCKVVWAINSEFDAEDPGRCAAPEYTGMPMDRRAPQSHRCSFDSSRKLPEGGNGTRFLLF